MLIESKSVSGGTSAFVDLTDVPASYSGQGGKKVKVNGTETALEFVADTSASCYLVADWANLQTDYGATGNGTTDDTTAWNNAINSGRHIYVPLPSSKYRITAKLAALATRSQRIQGQGWDVNRASTIYKDAADCSVFEIAAHGVRIEDIFFDHPSTGVTSGHTILYGTDGGASVYSCQIDNIYIRYPYNGLTLYNGSTGVFRNVKIASAVNNGLYLRGQAPNGDNKFSDCAVLLCANGLKIEGFDLNHFTSCKFINNTHNAVITSSYGTLIHQLFTACSFENNLGGTSDPAINITKGAGSLYGLSFINCESAVTGGALYVGNNCNDIKWVGGQITSISSIGIDVYGQRTIIVGSDIRQCGSVAGIRARSTASGLVVAGNISTLNGYGIQVDSGATYLSITGNDFRGNSVAASIDSVARATSRIVGNLGVDDNLSMLTAAATTLGSVVKKVEIFDATGSSLGFVPVYDSIT